MKRAFLFSIFTMVATCAHASGQTEAALGTRIPHAKPAEIQQGHYSPEERGRLALREFARCIVTRTPSRVSEALSSDVGAQQNQALAALAGDECLESGEMEFSASLLRGALFSEMYRRHEAVGVADWKWPIHRIDFSRVPLADDGDDAKLDYLMMYITDCLAGKEPKAIRSVVMEQVATKRQEAAFATIIPVLGACVPKGVTLSLNRTTLEAAFGEYMYRSLVPIVPLPEGKAPNA